MPRTAAADAAWTGGAGAAPACWRAAARVAPLARAAAGTAAARKAGVALSARCRRPWAGAAVGRSATGAAAGVAGTPALTAAARGPGGGAAGCSTSAGSTPAIAGRRGAAAGENRDRCDQRKGPSQVSRGLHSGHLAKVGNVDRRAVVQHARHRRGRDPRPAGDFFERHRGILSRRVQMPGRGFGLSMQALSK